MIISCNISIWFCKNSSHQSSIQWKDENILPWQWQLPLSKTDPFPDRTMQKSSYPSFSLVCTSLCMCEYCQLSSVASYIEFVYCPPCRWLRRLGVMTAWEDRLWYVEWHCVLCCVQLPSDLPISWNPRLTKTAGFCRYKSAAGSSSNKTVNIELSTKVCDSPGVWLCNVHNGNVIIYELFFLSSDNASSHVGCID